MHGRLANYFSSHLLPLPHAEDIKEACVLDAVLCVVDSKHVMQHLDEEKPEGIINEAGTTGG